MPGSERFEGTFQLNAFMDLKNVAYLKWGSTTGEIKMIWVHPEYRRRGIATDMYEYVQRLTSGMLIHSPRRTSQGNAWAHTVGGHLPANVFDRPMSTRDEYLGYRKEKSSLAS